MKRPNRGLRSLELHWLSRVAVVIFVWTDSSHRLLVEVNTTGGRVVACSPSSGQLRR